MKTFRNLVVITIVLLFTNCSNRPTGLYEFVSGSGEVKSINIVTDSTAVISSNKSGIGINVKYKVEKNFIIFYNIPYLGQAAAEIIKDGIKMPSGEIFLKKASSSVPSISSNNSPNKKSDHVSTSGTNNTSDTQLTPPELEAQKKFIEILDKNSFVKSNGLTSIISLACVSNDKYILNVLSSNGQEVVQVVNVRGTYHIIPSKSLQDAELILYPDKVQKSPAYDTYDGLRIDYFINSNTRFTLRKFEKSDLKKYIKENPSDAESNIANNDLPKYVLDGNIVFYSDRIKTQAEKDSIAASKSAEQRRAEKKKNDLEEKLKGW